MYFSHVWVPLPSIIGAWLSKPYCIVFPFLKIISCFFPNIHGMPGDGVAAYQRKKEKAQPSRLFFTSVLKPNTISIKFGWKFVTSLSLVFFYYHCMQNCFTWLQITASASPAPEEEGEEAAKQRSFGFNGHAYGGGKAVYSSPECRKNPFSNSFLL